MRYSRDGWSIEAAIAKGRTLPSWYLDRPDEQDGDQFYLSAFWDLSTCRQNGWSPGPIPWNHIRDYAEYAGLDRDNGFRFAAIIRRMDAYYLDALRAQSSVGQGGRASLPWNRDQDGDSG